MAPIEIAQDVHWVGALHPDRKLFDSLIPLPHGTSYNSYLVRGSEKTVLIDTVDPSKAQELIVNLKTLGVKKIDYVIANHAEQDHSGSLPKILELYPAAQVVTNQACRQLLMDLLLIPKEKFIVIKDGEKLSLGSRTLEFMLTPWVHWPETMFTCLKEERILFTCDFFGSHSAEGVFPKDKAALYDAAKFYYAEIMMPYAAFARKALQKAMLADAKIIAPSHGPVYTEPKFIIDAYNQWTSGNGSDVVIPYVSMHGSTQKMAEYLAQALGKRKITAKLFDLSTGDLGAVASALVDANVLVLGTPAYITGPHPQAVYAAYLINATRPKLKAMAIIGSYGWGATTVEHLRDMLGDVNAEMLEPVFIRGYPKKEDFELLEKLADAIAEKEAE
ncbi:Type A flavoprotein FprA [uncultured archaeon]|nr:Type A flavoprotein FprA [uncultured archaeon]